MRITALLFGVIVGGFMVLFAARPRVRHINKRDYPDDNLFI